MANQDVRALIQSILNIIEESLLDEITVEQLVASSYLSRSQCYALFKATTGYSIKEYLRKRRLSHIAYTMIPLKSNALLLSEFSHYASSESFVRAFKRNFSMTLSEYRNLAIPFELFPPCTLLVYRHIQGGTFMQFDQSKFQQQWSKGATLLDIDIDQFISVNDTYGRQGGDAVISTTFQRLLKTPFHEGVYRIGGDEFVMIIKDPTVNLEDACTHILQTLSQPIDFLDQSIQITVSIGVAKFTQDPSLSSAQEAMIQAKKLGRNQAI